MPLRTARSIKQLKMTCSIPFVTGATSTTSFFPFVPSYIDRCFSMYQDAKSVLFGASLNSFSNLLRKKIGKVCSFIDYIRIFLLNHQIYPYHCAMNFAFFKFNIVENMTLRCESHKICLMLSSKYCLMYFLTSCLRNHVPSN